MGLGLFYGVMKFFDTVGDRLNENTKLEIGVWLLGVRIGQKMEPWSETFANIFDRVFGKKHFSWSCFWRSCLASFASLGITLLVLSAYDPDLASFRAFLKQVSPSLRHDTSAAVLLFVGCSLSGMSFQITCHC